MRLGWTPDWQGRDCIRNHADLPRLAQHIDAAIAAGVFAFDTETTGLEVLDGARMFMFSLSYPYASPEARAVPVGMRANAGYTGNEIPVMSLACFVGDRHKGLPKCAVDYDTVVAELTRLFTSGAKCVMFNAKFDAKMLWADGVPCEALESDTGLDLYVLDPGFGDSLPETLTARKEGRLKPNEALPRNLKDLCAVLLNLPADERDEIKSWLTATFGANRKKWRYECLPPDLVGTYACGDTERTLALYHYTQQLLKEREQTTVAKMEAELSLVVAEVELNGMPLNEDAAKRVRGEQAVLSQTANDTMLELTGLANVNFGSDDVLIRYAWPALNRTTNADYPVPGAWDIDTLTPYAVKKRGSTKVEAVADKGAHGQFCAALLHWRGAEHIIAVIDAWLLKWARRGEETGELRLHPELKQDGADTGRFSCRDPQLQNINADARVCGSLTNAIVFIDYSQIEFRTFAHYAGGDLLAAYLKDKHVDFHQVVADIMCVPRKQAKGINFGMLYGMGREKLIFGLCNLSEEQHRKDEAALTNAIRTARMTNRAHEIPPLQAKLNAMKPALAKIAEAAATYTKYNEKFPAAKQLYYECQKRAKLRGWIKNLFGRRRYLPENRSQVALNTLIQGGAADLVKRAMLRVAVALREFNAKHNTDARMLLQIHDELVFEVRADLAKALADWMCPVMEAEPLLKCPLVAEASVCWPGEIWKDKHSFEAATK